MIWLDDRIKKLSLVNFKKGLGGFKLIIYGLKV